MRFTALLHHISPELLWASYFDLKRQAAPGVDEVTWRQYGGDLEERLADLHERIHRGRYRAQPSKRAWIPKPDGRQRPLGIAAFAALLVMGFTTWSGWWTWAFFALLTGLGHPEPLNNITPLDGGRKFVGLLTLGLFFLLFTPKPF